MNNHNTRARQQGVVLFVALILLVITTLLGLHATRGSALQILMAGNEQERMVAFETSQASIDAVVANKANYPVVGDPGLTNCNAVETDCDRYTVALSGPPFDEHEGMIGVRVTRLAPGFSAPPRGLETSADKFAVSSFSVRSDFNDTEAGGGRSQIVQGLMVLVPKSSQSN